MASRWVVLAAALVMLPSFARADGVSAADKETARTLMDEGRSLRDASDLKGALQRFMAADQIMHVPTTTLEVANTQIALGMLVEASDALARILNMARNPREPVQFVEARSKAQGLFDSLQARIPAVTITLLGTPDGAKVDDTLKLTIDGVDVATAVVGLPRSVDPGHHAVSATMTSAEGHAEFDVAEGEKKALPITMQIIRRVETKAPEPVVDQVEPDSKGHGGRTAAFVSFGVGAAALVAAGITGVLTLTTRSDLADKCFDHVCGPAQAGELADGNTFALVSTITFAAAGTALVVGVIALALSGHKATPPSSVPSAHVTPWIAPAGAGIFASF